MLLSKRISINKEKLKNYFEYENEKNISIVRVISLVIVFIFIFNIVCGVKDIIDMKNYIEVNKISQNTTIDSRYKKNTNNKKMDIKNIKKVFETVGIENLDSLYVDENRAKIVGRTNNIMILEKLMKNKILRDSYVKKINGGETYTFEIDTGV